MTRRAVSAGPRKRLGAGGATAVGGLRLNEPAAAHASAVLVPAVLAVGEARGCDGASLLDAYIVGLEAMGRVGEAVNYEHYERGWHATSTLGPIGAGAACGRLLGLDTEQMRACMSLAFSLAGGSKRQLGAMAKPVHAGLAAQPRAPDLLHRLVPRRVAGSCPRRRRRGVPRGRQLRVAVPLLSGRDA